MGRNFFISVLVHAVILTATYFGLPAFMGDRAVVDVPISVEIMTVADVTNVPSKPKKIEPKPVKKAKPKPPPPPPKAPQGSVEKPPEPEPVPEPEPPKDETPVIAEPEPLPKPIEKPKPKPIEPPKKVESKTPKPAPLPPRKPKLKAKKKPKPQDSFESVLKTLEELKKAPPPPKKPEPEMDFAKMMKNVLDKPNTRNDVGPTLTISEIDLVRQQIHRCWNFPAGAKDAHKMLISIRIAMNPDGTVRTARILDQSRMSSNPFYRAMADSALRAVLNPKCQPFKLPPGKYERWKNMKLNFDPKEMFGL